MKTPAATSLVMLLVLLAGQPASAQLFGERTTGSTVSRRAAPSAQSRQTAPNNRPGQASSASTAPALEAVGSIVDEEARFLRGNRTAADFVGSDAGEARAFVGSQQATGDAEIRSAIDEAPVAELSDVNLRQTPVIPPRMQLNAPRLQVGFATTARPPAELSRQLTARLQARLAADSSSPIAVSLADGEALLRGVVASARDHKLAELLVRLEPGVARVRNELQIVPPLDPLPGLPAASSRQPQG